MSINQAYSQWASSYDSDTNLTRDLDATITRQILADYQPKMSLELGCGTGKNTVFLAQISTQHLALDFSSGMLAQARQKITAPNVSFAHANLTHAWPCAAASIDLIICNLVLEHIENLAPIFAEAQRVLAPNGQFFISELHPFKQYQGKQAVFERDNQKITIAAYPHHISDFISAAYDTQFKLAALQEWWHQDDENAAPRLISFLFQK